MAKLKNKDEQYRGILKYKKPKSSIIGRITDAARALFMIVFSAAAAFFLMRIIMNYDDAVVILESLIGRDIFSPQVSSAPIAPSPKLPPQMMKRYQNLLLLGVDSNGPDTLPFAGVRSDTIIILSVDSQNRSFNAVSIPRDSKVYISDGHGIQKINSAYALGGIDLAKKTIEETLGIKIHNYIVINSEGVKKLIDTIGGVPIYIDQNMNYDDYSSKLHIHFKKGDYVLNGQESENYLRYRKDFLGDIGRVHRQQKFINALMKQLKTPEALAKIPEALKIAALYSKTDLNLYQMTQYASMIKDFDFNKTEFTTLPGAPNKKGSVSYWILDPEKVQKAINRLIYRQRQGTGYKELTAGIIYTRSKEIDAFNLRDVLRSSGYEVNCTGRSAQIEKSQIIRYNSAVSKDLIKDIKEAAPEIAGFEYTHSAVKSFCSESDIVITMKD